MDFDDTTAKALCGVMEKALTDYGIDAILAKTLAERACQPVVRKGAKVVRTKAKRKASAYSKKYGAAFKRVAKKYKKKNGGWKKDGFRLAQAAAHRIARGGKR